MNKVILMGRLVANPEFSMTQSGLPMCRFRIAVDRGYTKPGEEKQADFFNVTCWRQTAEFVNKWFVQGKPIIVEGKIQNNNYTDNNGVKHYADQVIADSVYFTISDPKNSNGSGYNNNNYNNNGYNNGGYNNNGYNNNGGYNNNNYNNNNGYNNGGYNNNGYNNNGGYQNNNFNNNQPDFSNAPSQQPSQPKDVQLGSNDAAGGSDFNDFEDIISDNGNGNGGLPF